VNSAAVTTSEEERAAAASGAPIPARANMTTRGARSTAAGLQVHHKDPTSPPTATAVSSQPVAAGRA
jgi:hypothetical protein